MHWGFYKAAPVHRAAGKAPARPHAALGRFLTPGVKGYGGFAAPVVVGRKVGLPTTPALTGLFRKGDGRTPALGVSNINAMATNVLRGSF
jgi:hypothetical protein